MTKRNAPKDANKIASQELENLMWKVHTPNLLKEIMSNPTVWALKQPLRIFSSLLQELAACAIELNDPKLNLLMARLTLYDQADPTSTTHDPDIISQLLQAIEASKQDVDKPQPRRHGTAKKQTTA